MLVVAGWAGISFMASGLWCSSLSVVWCRSVVAGLTMSSLVEEALVVEVGEGRFPADTPNLKCPSPACRLPSFAFAMSSATTACSTPTSRGSSFSSFSSQEVKGQKPGFSAFFSPLASFAPLTSFFSFSAFPSLTSVATSLEAWLLLSSRLAASSLPRAARTSALTESLRRSISSLFFWTSATLAFASTALVVLSLFTAASAAIALCSAIAIEYSSSYTREAAAGALASSDTWAGALRGTSAAGVAPMATAYSASYTREVFAAVAAGSNHVFVFGSYRRGADAASAALGATVAAAAFARGPLKVAAGAVAAFAARECEAARGGAAAAAGAGAAATVLSEDTREAAAAREDASEDAASPTATPSCPSMHAHLSAGQKPTWQLLVHQRLRAASPTHARHACLMPVAGASWSA